MGSLYVQLGTALRLALLEDDKPEPNYSNRYLFVMDAMLAARRLGIPAGIRLDPKEPDWPVVFIELPTGQVTWHIEQHKQEWDNHTTEEKHERVRAFLSLQLV